MNTINNEIDYEELLKKARLEISYQKVFYNACVKILYPV